ncbi:uncharacterized protein LOC105398380 isoform X1 [Plutella xylostella]|uniref:uncharacterized protein LOC105398380 isoform X1 n=1 Tax=Plutella xylostella TaxID=51655 RepID=UPI002032DC23|nr:uncharacterized protein LOC105398380 isoform X1 [Plutella xylostella]
MSVDPTVQEQAKAEILQSLNLSSFKLWSVWYKKDVFEQRIADLVDIWPVPPLAPELQAIKDKSLLALRIAHRFFFGLNVSAVWIFNLTPVMIYVYESWWQGRPDAVVGFPWTCWYPFDKWDPTNHVFVYLFEILSGVTCVWAMSASDLMLTGMASHICMLLRILHQRLTSLAARDQPPPDHYRDILLEPLSALSNKMFLGAALIQVGVICWYADDIYHANSAVAAAAYSCQWHKTSPSCQRALMFLIKRY